MVDVLMLAGAFVILTFLELVLVVDNALVIILMCKDLPEGQRERTEKIGIMQGAFLRVVLILLIGWITRLAVPIPGISPFMERLSGHEFTIQSAINLGGGLILIGMAAYHIRQEWKPGHHKAGGKTSTVWGVLAKAFGVSLIFSIDSVMSAVGTVDNLYVAGAAVLLAAIVMIFAVKHVSAILARYPDLKSLGLAFVLMIGGFLVAESFGAHIPKAIIFGCLAFGLFVQLIDIFRDRAKELREELAQKRRGQMSLEEVKGA